MDQPYVRLNNGSRMPLLGLGAYDMHQAEAEKAVGLALEIGYRLIDTAAMYRNEREVGNAIKNSKVPRSEIYLTTKVANEQQGFDETRKAFDESCRLLDVDYIDLYLVHWPIKMKRKETWRALEKLYEEGRVKAIGVANYLIPFLQEMKEYGSIIPAVNQVEFSPFLYLEDLLSYCREQTIQLQSYSPLTRGKKFSDPSIQKLAAKHNRTPAQILVRWNLQMGVSTIPKSSNRERLRENFNALWFSLPEEDMHLLNQLNENFRVVDDPMPMF
jgi:diketogulonate reductase-like aldo/keto reductase